MFQLAQPSPVATLELVPVEQKQPLLYVPVRYLHGVPKNYLAEFEQIDVDIMRLRFVAPKAMVAGKRVQIVRHHGGIQVSVPRTWLRDRGAMAGDRLEVYEETTGSLLVVLISVSNPTGDPLCR